MEGLTRKNRAGIDDEVYNANRTTILRIFCESKVRDEEQYRIDGEIIRGELNILLLPGMETVGLDVSTDISRESQILSKGITSLYRVISSLSMNGTHEQMINWHNCKLLQYVHHALLPSSFTCLVSLIHPTASRESISYNTLLFSHRMRKIAQNPIPCKIMNKGVVVKYLKERVREMERLLKEKDV